MSVILIEKVEYTKHAKTNTPLLCNIPDFYYFCPSNEKAFFIWLQYYSAVIT
jgi:hypothetical protein